MVERVDHDMCGDLEPAAQEVPHRDTKFSAGLGEAQESIPAVTAILAACSGADLA